MTTSTKWGDEFQVNTTTDKDQINPEVAALLNGRFMAVWTDQSTPPGLEGLEPGDLDDLDPDDLPALFRIRAQMYEADGTPSGDEFVVNTSDYGLQAGAQIAVQADGTFLITWLAVAIEFQSGGIVAGSISILAQRFGPDGSPVGNEFAVAEELNPIAAGSLAQAGGRYASVWFDGANGITKLQVINADGTLSGTPVSFAGIATPEIAGLDNGRFVIAAVSAGAQVVVQITENDGSPVSGPLELESSADFVDGVTITALANGRFVVAWRANDAGDSTIRGQLFNADGTLIGEEFLASTGIFARDPTITGLPDGRFFIAWEGVDSSSNGIRGQMFDPDGNKVGFEHIINATTEERQASVSVTTLADGRIAVVWDDSSNDDAVGDEIRGQILDPRTEPVSLRGGAEHDSLVGTFLADTLKGGRGPDLLLGENGNDVVHGGRGKDTIFGGGGNDLLRGGRGNDALDGGFGFDKSKGGRGDDTHVIDSTGDTVVERAGEGTDTVVSASVDLNLKTHDNVEDAKATGTADLSLKGSAGKNKLVGNAGDNRIKGLADADKLKGRDGDDTYLFAKVKHSKPSDPDTIIGFERDADVIHLGGIDAIAGGTDDPFAFIGKSGFSGSAGELRVARKGDDVKVSADVDGDGKADFATIVKDIQKLGEDDFVL